MGSAWPAGLALCALLLVAGNAAAQLRAPALGATASGLRGLIYTGMPLTEPELNLAAGAGYGMTEAFEPVPGAHHRAHGSLGAALAPEPWLAFALRLDGRLEMHPDDGRGAHSAGFGDPRLFARIGHALSPAASAGVELGLWFPGSEAPSFEPSATSAEARALFAFAPPDARWALLASAGFRLDNSAQAAPDLARLRLGDRIALGLSASHAVLAAVGAAYRFGSAAEAFVEGSADLLLDAPELGQSPLRAALGGRWFATRALQAELSAIVSLSSRPEVTPRDPLLPIEPRLLLLAGLRYTLGLAKVSDEAALVEPEPPAPEPVAPPAPQFATVSGTVADDTGAPLPEAKITLTTADGETRETITDALGRYMIPAVPVGPATIEVSAVGFGAQRWQLAVTPTMAPEPPRALAPATDTGVLRGLVRAFDSTPLRARITVRDGRRRTVAEIESGDDGRFELELAPGGYEVEIAAPGFAALERSVQIAGNAVAILNVDLREQP